MAAPWRPSGRDWNRHSKEAEAVEEVEETLIPGQRRWNSGTKKEAPSVEEVEKVEKPIMRRAPGKAVRMLITGRPGVGKTTLCSKVHSHLKEVLGDDLARCRITGFLSEEQRNEQGYRVGFDMVTLDGSQRARLASQNAPNNTEFWVNKYGVLIEEFEALTLPILDKVLDERNDQGIPRAFIFDEIGKMEMFSKPFEDRVRRLLTSPDPCLHVLGTVALYGGRFIADSKRMPGVHVVEIDESSRDERCSAVAAHFAELLTSSDAPSDKAAPYSSSNNAVERESSKWSRSSKGEKKWTRGSRGNQPNECEEGDERSRRVPKAAPSGTGAQRPAQNRTQDVGNQPDTDEEGDERSRPAKHLAPELTRVDVDGLRASFDIPGPGAFSSVFLSDPGANFASVNAGDYLLYVGGAAINRAFRDALDACGVHTKDRFEVLHEALLAAASKAPGQLCHVGPGELFGRPTQAEAVVRGRCRCCGKVTDCWEVQWPSNSGKAQCEACWQWFEGWAFDGLLSFSGLVPADVHMEPLRPVGLVSLATFAPGKRPCKSESNVAMVYVVGPNCGDKRKKGRRDVDKMSKEDFLQVIETVATSISKAVEAHNSEATGEVAEAIPKIDILRVCLLSGGVYKHPDATKVEVAMALIRGLVGVGGSAELGGYPASPSKATPAALASTGMLPTPGEQQSYYGTIADATMGPAARLGMDTAEGTEQLTCHDAASGDLPATEPAALQKVVARGHLAASVASPTPSTADKAPAGRALLQYLHDMFARVDGKYLDASELRTTIMPKVVAGVQGLSAGAPEAMRQELHKILTEKGVLPDYAADAQTFADALRDMAGAIGQAGTPAATVSIYQTSSGEQAAAVPAPTAAPRTWSTPCLLDFAFDEDVFRQAWQELGLPGLGAGPAE